MMGTVPLSQLVRTRISRISTTTKFRGREQGSMSIEAVLIIPAFLVFLALIAAIGRTAAVQEDLHASVVAGARIASLAPSSSVGETQARTAIENHLADEGVKCTYIDISINSHAVDPPPGQPG